MEFLQEYWAWILGTLVPIISSIAVPALRPVWGIIFKTVVSKRMFIKALIYLGDKAVDDGKINFWDVAWVDTRKSLVEALKK